MSSRRAHSGRRPDRLRRGEDGVALIMAIVVTLIAALIVGGVAQVILADLEMARLTQWDGIAQYLAQAGLEHQIYLLKDDKDAVAIPYTNYPVTADQRGWYTTSLTCLLNCSGNVAARRWRIQSTGEIREYNGIFYTVLLTRTISANVDITYDGVTPNLYRYPQSVVIRRWEEVLP